MLVEAGRGQQHLRQGPGAASVKILLTERIYAVLLLGGVAEN